MDGAAIEVFWASGSCPSWRVLLALEVKGVPYASRLLQFSQREHKSPEHLAMNPRGKVPVLRDGDFTLYESIAILAYLDRRFPDPPLFGVEPRQTGLIWRYVSECLAYVEPAMDAVCLPIYRGKAMEQVDALRAACERAHAELAPIEARLADAGWLVGTSVTAADLALLPHLQHLRRATTKPEVESLDLGFAPLGARYPGIAAWLARIGELPGFARTWPPHWR